MQPELTDAEVFGTQQPPQRELSDEEVFGQAPPTARPPAAAPTAAPSAPAAPPPPVAAEFSDADVFGGSPLPVQPTPAAPAAPKPESGVLNYIDQLGNAVIQGGESSLLSGRLKGLGGASEARLPGRELEAAIQAIQQGSDIGPAAEQGTAQPAPARPATESPIYQAGQAIGSYTEKNFPTDLLNPVVRDVAAGLGSVGGNIASAIVPGGVATIPLAEMGQVAEKAVQDKATAEQQEQATRLGFISGATDLADLLIPGLGSTGKALGFLAKLGPRGFGLVSGALMEGGQEGLQQLIDNMIARGVYNPNQDIWQDVPYNAFIGGIVGGAFGSFGHGKRGGTEGQPLTDQEIMQLGDRILQVKQGATAGATISPSTERLGVAAPAFVGNAYRAIEAKMPNVATADQIAGILNPANTPGLRQEELDHLQIPQYLSDMRAGGKILKSDFLEYLQGERIRVHAIRLSDTDETGMPAQYETYTTPGPRQNYTELLLTLGDTALDNAKYNVDLTHRRLETLQDLRSAANLGGYPPQIAQSNATIAAARSEADQAFAVYEQAKKQVYQDPHFAGVENPVVHVRFSERLDHLGQPMTFIEEIQSGHAQAERQFGLRGDEVTLEKHAISVAEKGVAWKRATDSERQGIVRQLMNQYRSRQPPKSLPFFGKTKDWTNLAFKRILREAADRGVQRVAWVNGGLAAEFSAGGVRDPGIMRGLSTHYDQTIPSIAKTWATKLGGTLGSTFVQGDIPKSELDNNTLKLVEVPAGGRGTLLPGTTLRMGTEAHWTWRASDGSEYGVFQSAQEAQSYMNVLRQPVRFIEVPRSSFVTVQQGLTLFQKEDIGTKMQTVVDLHGTGVAPGLVEAARKVAPILDTFVRKFGLAGRIQFYVTDQPLLNMDGSTSFSTAHLMWYGEQRTGIIRVNLTRIKSTQHLYSTVMHELGHAIMFDTFESAPLETKLAVSLAYANYKKNNVAGANKVMQVVRARNNAIRMLSLSKQNLDQYQQYTLGQLSPEDFRYQTGMSEWFAEQVARWATSDAKPLGIVERLFSGLGRKIIGLLHYASERFGIPFTATPAMSEWLNSYLMGTAANNTIGFQVVRASDAIQLNAQNALGLQVPAAPPGPGPAVQQTINQILGGTPLAIAQNSAHADRMNWVYRWMAGLGQLRDANPRFTPLVNYYERMTKMHSEEAQWHDAAMKIAKDWGRLKPGQADALARLVQDLHYMSYRTPSEVQRGVVRHPTQQEFAALVRTHRLDTSGARVYQQMTNAQGRGFIDIMLKAIEQQTIERAIRTIANPAALQQRVTQIQAQMANLTNRPFFPFMHFGNHFITVRNPAGDLVHFETFERDLLKLKTARGKQVRRMDELARRFPGHTINDGILPESTQTMLGMPPLLLEAIQQQLQVTSDDLLHFATIRAGLNPTTAFRNAVAYQKLAPGFSTDLRRSFAKWAFHSSRYLTRTKYADFLRADIVAATQQPGYSASRIAKYMSSHLKYTVLDARGDFGAVRGAIFLWAMGYVPAAATQNLSQTPMITLPFLGAKFGDVGAVRALSRAMFQLSTYYKKGSYPTTGPNAVSAFDLKALGYLIKTGRVSETQSSELAGLGQGMGLLKGEGGNLAQRSWAGLMSKAGWMFEMAEQFNRRIAARAALDLAQRNPNAKGVREAMQKYGNEYQDLLADFSPAEARAIVTAIHVVDSTQFVYARYDRPPIFQGPIGATLFVFKRYMQSTLFMLAHNKGDVLPRYLLIAALVGGLGGMPGYDDFRDILKGFLQKLFGRDFDPERELRKYINQFSNGTVSPDLVLHGLARFGLGIPALLDMLGSLATGRPGRGFDPAAPGQNVPFPTLDRAKALGLGNILPVEVGKLMGSTDVSGTIAEQTQRASGAVFSVGFNIYKMLMDKDHDWTDFKRWERAIPRALGSASKSFRTLTEGRERYNPGGSSAAATFQNYDWRDPEQAMEMLAMAMGYNNLRSTYKWDAVMAERDMEKYYDFRRQGLMGNLQDAIDSGDEERREAAVEKIRDFNASLEDRARGKAITGDQARQSLVRREQLKAAKEAGVADKRSNAPIREYLETIFPGAVQDVRRR